MDSRIGTLVFTVALAGFLLILAPPVNGQATRESACKGKFKGRKEPTREQLSEILKNHSHWSLSGRKEGTRANLCEAELRGVDLSRASLNWADLSKASLFEANLSKAHLFGANLRGANLNEANLREADLESADLSGATLVNANLNWAVLAAADLSGATLIKANLSWAVLAAADLSGANLREADLGFSFFELEPGSLPSIQNVALARNLSKMIFINTPLSMVELREEFKKKGLRQQERELTFAIKHTERIYLWKRGVGGKIESAFQYILFEITSDYGMSPWRPLVIVVILIPLFSVPYMIGLKMQGRSRIWAVLPEERVHKGRRNAKTIQVAANRTGQRKGPLARWFRILRIALYFSLLSAFRIGWRELNVGNWITRLQSREYILRATGWVRTVSGVQSLISVYLIALWILTYFGRPFE